MKETAFTAGNILSSSTLNLQLWTHIFRVCFPCYLYCCYAIYRFLSFPAILSNSMCTLIRH